MENFSKFIDSYILSKVKKNPHQFLRIVTDGSVAYENVKRFSPNLNFKVFKFEGNDCHLELVRIRKAVRRKNFKSGFHSSSIVKNDPMFGKCNDSEQLSHAERTKKHDELKFLVDGINSHPIQCKAVASRVLLTTDIEEVNSLEREKFPFELVSAKNVHLSRQVDGIGLGNIKSNAICKDNSLFETIKHCDEFLLNSSRKTLLKKVEVHKGKKFVRMVPVSFSLRINTNDDALDSREKFTVEKCNKQVIVKNHLINFFTGDNAINDNIIRNFLANSGVINKNRPSNLFDILNNDLDKIAKRSSESSIRISNKVSSKNSFSEIYRLFCGPVEDDIKLRHVWNNAPGELAEGRESSLRFDTTSISSYDKVENSYVTLPDSPTVRGNGEMTFNSGFSRIDFNESEDEWEMIASLNSELLNCQKLLIHLENTYEKVRKEFFTVLFHSNQTDTKDFTTSEPIFEKDSVCYYSDPHRKESSKIFANSNSSNSHQMKSKGLENYQSDHLSTFQHSGRYIYHLNDTSQTQRPFYEDESHCISLKQNYNTSSVSSQDRVNISNECDDQLLTLPSNESLILFSDILLRLQNTYEIVRKDVYSWLISKDNHQNIGGNINCGIVETSIGERSSVANGNCLMKFNARNLDTINRKYYDSKSSDSISSLGLHSDLETLEYSSMDESESELDDSGSSLDGSFKQHSRADSRESMTSSDNDDSDEIQSFSLPSYYRKRNSPKFNLSKTVDFLDKVSTKQWSWKSGENEFTVKCAQSERRLRSETQVNIRIPEGLQRFQRTK